MRSGLKVGNTAEVRARVTEDMCPAFEGVVVHHVYSTWSMAHHMELAARKVLAPYLEEHEEGIGSHLSIDHLANLPRPYVPRSFSSISKILDDINRSRVYLGVHWNFDCVRGAESGERVATIVYDSLYQRTRANGPPAVSELQQRRLSKARHRGA